MYGERKSAPCLVDGVSNFFPLWALSLLRANFSSRTVYLSMFLGYSSILFRRIFRMSGPACQVLNRPVLLRFYFVCMWCVRDVKAAWLHSTKPFILCVIVSLNCAENAERVKRRMPLARQ